MIRDDLARPTLVVRLDDDNHGLAQTIAMTWHCQTRAAHVEMCGETRTLGAIKLARSAGMANARERWYRHRPTANTWPLSLPCREAGGMVHAWAYPPPMFCRIYRRTNDPAEDRLQM